MTPPINSSSTSPSLFKQFDSWARSQDTWLNQNADSIVYPVIDYGTAGIAPTLLEASGLDAQVNKDSPYLHAYEVVSSLNSLKHQFQQFLRNSIQWMTDKKVVQQLPQLKGKSESAVRSILTKFGFTQTKVSNSPARNEDWKHNDNSVVLIHPYGDRTQGDYRSGNNAHVHKKAFVEGEELMEFNDHGVMSSDKNDTHIGIRNPKDLPVIRNRPHGEGEK